MGNISNKSKKLKNSKKKNSGNLTYTSLGRHTPQNFNAILVKNKTRNNDLKNRITINVYEEFNGFHERFTKDSFPTFSASNTRNTMNPNTIINHSNVSSMNTLFLLTDECKEVIFPKIEIQLDDKAELTYYDTPKKQIEGEIKKMWEQEKISENRKKVETVESDEFELKFDKSGEELRKSYIEKLLYKKVWQPSKKEKDHNAIIIFDWDDTLLCTSYLTPNGVFTPNIKVSDIDLQKFKKLEKSVFQILSSAISKGDTYIITNAAPGWVEYSANRFFPLVAQILPRVKIVSARGEYGKKYPHQSRTWKILAFLEMLNKVDTHLVTNLICLGDSIIEMEAAHILASKFDQAFIKTFKFRENPKPEELNKQICLVLEQFDKVFSEIKNLTIRIEKKFINVSKRQRSSN